MKNNLCVIFNIPLLSYTLSSANNTCINNNRIIRFIIISNHHYNFSILDETNINEYLRGYTSNILLLNYTRLQIILTILGKIEIFQRFLDKTKRKNK